jgi:hypothetical protein
MSAVRPPAELLHGVSLEQFAGVAAALAEGFPLAEVLANEQIPPAVWPRADAAWKARAARDGAAGPVFAGLREKRALAEDCLSRRVVPIDTDLDAWMSFLLAYGAHPAPAQMLESAGLGMNDLSRLQRFWSRRMDQDKALSRKAGEIAKRGPPPLSALRVAPAKLTLFPWSKGRAVEAVDAAPRAVVPADTSMAPGQLRLYSYVAIKARLAESPGNEQRVLEQLGQHDFATTDAGWQAVLRDNEELARDYRRLLDVARVKIRASAAKAPASPGAPHGESPSVAAAPPLPRAAPPQVVDSGATPALPPRAPANLAGTALAVDVPRKLVLPFAGGAAAVAASSPPAGPVVPAPRGDLSGTSMALDVPRGDALPFPAAAPPPAAAQAPVAPPSPPPSLTLQQHASLCCELTEAPERAAETLARYRVTPAEKHAADQRYAAQFAREPAARTAWDAAYATYRAWWQASQLSR